MESCACDVPKFAGWEGGDRLCGYCMKAIRERLADEIIQQVNLAHDRRALEKILFNNNVHVLAAVGTTSLPVTFEKLITDLLKWKRGERV